MITNFRARVRLTAGAGVFYNYAAGFNNTPGDRYYPIYVNLPKALPGLGHRMIHCTVHTNLTIRNRVTRVSGVSEGGCYCPSLSGTCRVDRLCTPLVVNNCIRLSGNEGVHLRRVRVRRSTKGLVRRRNSACISCGHNNIPLVRVISRPSVHSVSRTERCIRGLRRIVHCVKVSSYGVRRNSVHYSMGVSIHPGNDRGLNAEARVGGVGSVGGVTGTVRCRFRERISLVRGNKDIIRRALHCSSTAGAASSVEDGRSTRSCHCFHSPSLIAVRIPGSIIRRVGTTVPRLPTSGYEECVSRLTVPRGSTRLLAGCHGVDRCFSGTYRNIGSPGAISGFVVNRVFHEARARTSGRVFSITIAPRRLGRLMGLLSDNGVHGGLTGTALRGVLSDNGNTLRFVDRDSVNNLSRGTLGSLYGRTIRDGPGTIRSCGGNGRGTVGSLIKGIVGGDENGTSPTLTRSGVGRLVN